MSEKECGKKAVKRFTWPGRDESFICQDHWPKLLGVAAAMGMYLQTIELPNESTETCKQRVSGN
mgnify:CR=1 FL=1